MRWFLYEKVAMKLPFDGNEHHYEMMSPVAILERRLQAHRNKEACNSRGDSNSTPVDDYAGVCVARARGPLGSRSNTQPVNQRDITGFPRVPFVPPFLIVHGSHDTVIPVEESDSFCGVLAEYRAAQRQSCKAAPQIRDLYLRVDGATHGMQAVRS